MEKLNSGSTVGQNSLCLLGLFVSQSSYGNLSDFSVEIISWRQYLLSDWWNEKHQLHKCEKIQVFGLDAGQYEPTTEGC